MTGTTGTTDEDGYVTPLRLTNSWYPVIVTDGETCIEEPKWVEETEPFTYYFRPERLEELAELPHIWATLHPPELFMRFYNTYRTNRDFTFRGETSAKELRPGLGSGSVGSTVRKFGFARSGKGLGDKGAAGRSHARRMHFFLDLRGFLEDKLPPDLEGQYNLAVEIRNFCHDMGIGPKLNFAGISSALLRHPNFYPDPRKRVPEFINEKARLHLPGNHYDLFTETGRVYKSASYFDQRSAHHHAALVAPMPTSDSVRAKGFTRDEDSGGGRVWITPASPRWERVLAEYGLFMARVHVPALPEGDERYMPHNLRSPGLQSVPIWSSELPWLEEMGVRLLGLEWALTGNVIDEGIRRYAEWALETAQEHPAFKSALLCTYGLLAQRRGWSRSIRGVGAMRCRWDAQTFLGNAALGEAEFHSYGPTHVLQRGIIEAYTRMLTLRYVSTIPKDLQLGLYGDAVIVDAEARQFVVPMEPWREKGELSNLTFKNAVTFTSDQLSRLPGVRQGMAR